MQRNVVVMVRNSLISGTVLLIIKKICIVSSGDGDTEIVEQLHTVT